MSSCKTLSSKISFGRRFHGFTSDCVKGHFLLFLFNLVPAPFWAASHIYSRKSYPRTDLHPHSKCPHHPPLTAGLVFFLCLFVWGFGFFWFFFLIRWLFGFLYFIGKGQLEKEKKDGWLILFGGDFNWRTFYISMSISLSFFNALTQFETILHQLQWDLASVSFQPPSYHFSCTRQLWETSNKDYTLSKIRTSLTEPEESPQ